MTQTELTALPVKNKSRFHRVINDMADSSYINREKSIIASDIEYLITEIANLNVEFRHVQKYIESVSKDLARFSR